MSRRILIVHGDASAASALRHGLEQRGFTAETLLDAGRSEEFIRQQQPDLVVIAVELAQGQNGYLLCGKLKKGVVLGRTPLILTGNPDGFAAHRKLKAHADGYLAAPADANALAALAEELLRGDDAPRAPAAARQDDASTVQPASTARGLWAGFWVALAVTLLAVAWLVLR